MNSEIAENVKKIICECMPGLDPASIGPDTVINRDMNMDSLNFILVVTKIEGFFEIQIPDKKWSGLSTFEDIVGAVEKALKKKKKADSVG